MTPSNIDHVELVSRAVRDIGRVNAKGWGRVNCPVCLGRTGKQDRKRSFGYNQETGKYHCFKCRVRGRLGSGSSTSQNTTVDVNALNKPDGYFPLWTDDAVGSAVCRPAIDYMRSRGVDFEVMRGAEIGACFRGRLAGRVVVPAIEPDGSWYGWIARVWTRHVDRGVLPYITASGMDTYSRMYNEAAIDVETDVPLILVEGVYDALPLWPHAAAFYGKPNEGQMARLLRARRPLVAALDGDAWIEGEMLAMRLQFEGKQCGWLRLPPKRDPSDVGANVIMRWAMSVFD